MPLDGPSEFLRPAKPGDLTPFLRKLLRGGTLASDESRMAFEEIASGESHHAEMGALLALLATRIGHRKRLACVRRTGIGRRGGSGTGG